MMKLATVLTYAPIENFKSTTTHAFIRLPKAEKVGDLTLAKNLKEAISSCSISVKYFQRIQKKEEPESKSTANQLARI
jgi:hypothetical protein